MSAKRIPKKNLRYVPFSDQPEQKGKYVFRWLSDDPVGSVFDFACDLELHAESKRAALRATPDAVWAAWPKALRSA
ncbi:MAG: hypothetical protein AAF466_05685, partial [Bacteroidota bacterium]